MEPYFKELEASLMAAIERLKQDLQGVRSGRPSTQLVENIQVEYAGQMLTVKQLGSLSIKPPREIDIVVWDQAAINSVTKAIQDAKAGLSISNEGNMIRAFLPPLTEERREELMKFVKKMAEEIRIKIRAHRDDVNKKLKAAEGAKQLSEDQAFKGKEKTQKLVDGANAKIETMVQNKLKELQE